MKIKSPYNFAPAPDEKDVFKPDWADQVSHDVPFSDGECGQIDFSMTAASPIFVRNGKPRSKEDKHNSDFSFYDTVQGRRYFLPGSSIKGMVRNVLEIISSSRLSMVDGVAANDEILFALRDMNNVDYSKTEIRNVKSGWLRKEAANWFIYPCVNHRIAIRDVERSFTKGQSLKNLSAVQKSEQVGAGVLKQWRNFSFADDLGKFVGKLYKFKHGNDGDEELEGRIVLFGDIDNKIYDYIFGKRSTTKIPVNEELFRKFKNLEDLDRKNSLLNFYYRNDIEDIPVFFKANERNTAVMHFGFSKLYRLNNAHYLRDIRPFSTYRAEASDYLPDLAELIFGYINAGRKQQSLKGRVIFTHAVSENASVQHKVETRILNTPKPSFYPAYLTQGDNSSTGVGNYQTYHSNDVSVRGFKRYPVHSNIKKDDPNIGTDAMEVEFIPLCEGAVFKGRLVYHNLRPVELGALLSALSFHNNAVRCFHSIGMAKPYGFGKVRVNVVFSAEHINAMKVFEIAMNEHNNKSWINTPAFRELYAASQLPKDETLNQLLQYPRLEPKNEFNIYKTNMLILEQYSVRNSISDAPISLISEEDNKGLSNKKTKQNTDLALYQMDKIEFDRKRNQLIANLKSRMQQRLTLERDVAKLEKLKIMHSATLTFNSFQFEEIKTVCNNLKGKVKEFVFSEQHQKDIITALETCLKKDTMAFLKKKKLAKLSEYPWTEIRKWIGEVNSKMLYDKSTNTI